MNVGIIGGGMAGLAAAHDLVKRGHKAAVFERAPFLGGQASTFTIGGGQLERAYHHLFRSDVDMVHLIEELGLGPKLNWIESKVGFFYGGKIHRFTTPMDLLRFKPLSFPNRVRLGLVSLRLQRHKEWKSLEGITAEEWIKKNAGKQAYDVVWGPLLRGKFGESAPEVGMVWFWGKIYLRFASRGKGMAKELLGYPMGSFGEVIDKLNERIKANGGETHINTPVTRVVIEEGKAVGLELQRPESPKEIRRFDAIISTTPSFVFPKLVPELPADYCELLGKVKYQAAILEVLALKRPLSHIYWMNIADRSIPFVAAIEHTNFIEKGLYGGKHIVYLSNYLGKSNPLYKATPDELFQAYLPHLKKINPEFDESWVDERYYHREEAAQPVIGVNYSKQIPPLETPIKNLYLANTTQIYPEDRGTNYSVRLGYKVARLAAP